MLKAAAVEDYNSSRSNKQGATDIGEDDDCNGLDDDCDAPNDDELEARNGVATATATTDHNSSRSRLALLS